MLFLSKLRKIFQQEEKTLPEERPYVALFLFSIEHGTRPISYRRMPRNAQTTVLKAVGEAIQDEGGWTAAGSLLGASGWLFAGDTLTGPNWRALMDCLKWASLSRDLLGLPEKELEKRPGCYVICLMALARIHVERAHAALGAYGGEHYKGALLYRPSTRKDAALFVSALGLPLCMKIQDAKAKGWSLTEEKLGAVGLEPLEA